MQALSKDNNITTIVIKINLKGKHFKLYPRLWRHFSSSLPMFSCQYHPRLIFPGSFSERFWVTIVLWEVTSTNIFHLKILFWFRVSPTLRCQGLGIWSRPVRCCSPPTGESNVQCGTFNSSFSFSAPKRNGLLSKWEFFWRMILYH